MIKITCIMLLSTFVSISSLWGSEDSPTDFPEIYNSFWPDFCPDHLTQYPNECSEYFTDEQGELFLEYFKGQSSNRQIDIELLTKISNRIHQIPLNSSTCDFRFCKECQTPVLRAVLSDYNPYLDEDGISYINSLGYKCNCLKSWYSEEDYETNPQESVMYPEDVAEKWIGCKNKSIPSIYFDIQNKARFHFFEKHLNYSEQNPNCLCYWPYQARDSGKISDYVFHRVVSRIGNLDKLDKETSQSITRSLFIYSFFYSQYYQLLTALKTWESSQVQSKKKLEIDTIIEAIQPQFYHLYSNCLTQHPHPHIYFERGLISFHQGKPLLALDDISSCIDLCTKKQMNLDFTSNFHLQQGITYSELGSYDLAVQCLTEAINKDPNNKNAYFERAAAYFELGDFELCLHDYLTSGIHQSQSPNSVKSLAFSNGLTRGIYNGIRIGTTEFIPTLIGSLQGLSNGLWAFVLNPIQISTEFIEASQACIKFLKENTSEKILITIVPEMRALIEDFNSIDDEKRGELTGYIIGKYGIEFFASTGIAKGINYYRTLKKANNLLTFEAMAVSDSSAALIKTEAANRAKIRKELFQNANLKIQWDKQGKHIATHRNFQITKSVLEHPDPQRLLNSFAGTGMRILNKKPGLPGYQEIVDFKEFIGYAVSNTTGEKIATSWGKIHYAKDGVHIVPTLPRN